MTQTREPRDWAQTLSDFLSPDFERSKRASLAYAAVVIGTLRELSVHPNGDMSQEDFVAEALLRLSKHGPSLRNPRASGAWIRQVTRHLYFDYLDRLPLPTAAAELEVQSQIQPLLDVQVMTAQVHKALLQAIPQLQRRYRDVIDVFYFGQRTISETAAELGVAEHTVRNHLRAAKAILARRLRRFGKPPVRDGEERAR